MAKIGRLSEFEVNHPERWESYVARVENYFRANQVREDGLKAATLLCVCGQDAFEIAENLAAPAPLESVTYTDLKKLLKEHFQPKLSVIAWRHTFEQRDQRAGESAKEYIAALRRAAKPCDFKDLEERLRDRLVCGLRNRDLQQRLFAKEDISFQDALREVTAEEAAGGAVKNMRPIRNNPEAISVHHEGVQENSEEDPEDEVDHLYPARERKQKEGKEKSSAAPKCFGCGGHHRRTDCRFRSAICRACGKQGHIAAVCLGRQKVQPREELRLKGTRVPSQNRVGFCASRRSIYRTGTHRPLKKKLSLKVKLQGVPLVMELDTGSALSIISIHTFRKICSSSRFQAKLRPSNIVLTDFQNSKVCVKGEATLNVQHKDFEGPLDVLVVGGERTSLIGLDWFEALGIQVTGLHSLQTLGLQEVCKEFADVFSPQLGAYKGPPVSLKLDPTVTPIRVKARRVPFALKGKIDAELDKLIQQGVLEPVDSSPWETPIVTPLKANGDIRICADYKCTLNKALQQHAYPVPVVSHILASLKGGRVFAKLDLAQAYQQLPVDEAAAEAQTIVTHRGAFKVKRLQFGVNVAPGIFQSVMENTLRGIPGVCPYFDDVLIAGESTQNLAERLRAVLLQFRKAGLKLKKDKCKIGVSSTDFLGYRIDAKGIHPAESKLKAILQAPRPKSKAELQAFLGLLNFYNAFIPNKANVAEPLHRLLDKQTVWQWSQAHEASFNEVKALLTSNDVLAHFNETLPVCIACDASPYGVGAVLSHLRPDGTQVPVAYYSRTLSSAERNYAQIDREALAIVAGIKKFHDFLYGRHFTVYTDHKPLLGLFTTNKQTPHIISPRMLRWSIFLSAYDFSLVHKPGKEMGHADGLSRLPLQMVEADPAPAINILSIQALPESPLNARDVAAESATDLTLNRVLSWVLSGWPENCPGAEFQSFWLKKHELSTFQGCLLWGSRVVIPTSMRPRVLTSLHEGHPGIVRMKALARSHLWWPGLDREIEAQVHGCHLCQRSRPEMPQAPIHKWEETQSPWSRVHIDYAGPFQGQFFLVLVDSYSKWLEVVPVSSTTAAKTIQVLRGIFAAHGLPDVLVSDNGPQFTSFEFQAFLQANMIRHATSAPFHPSTNGMAERMVRITKDALKKLTYGDWHHRLADFLLAYRTTPSTSTGKSPAELRWGRKLITKLDRLHPDRLPPKVTQPRAPRYLQVGAPVWTRNYGPGHLWVPAVVCKVTGPLSYEVSLDDGRVLRRHIDQLRTRLDLPSGPPGLSPGGEGDHYGKRDGCWQQPGPNGEATDGLFQGSASVPNRSSREQEITQAPVPTPARESPRGHTHHSQIPFSTPVREKNREHPNNPNSARELAHKQSSWPSTATVPRRKPSYREVVGEANPNSGTSGLDWGATEFWGTAETPDDSVTGLGSERMRSLNRSIVGLESTTEMPNNGGHIEGPESLQLGRSTKFSREQSPGLTSPVGKRADQATGHSSRGPPEFKRGANSTLSPAQEEVGSSQNMRRSQREKRSPKYLEDYVTLLSKQGE